MAPILHLVRHAEGHHNVGAGDDYIPDPELTPTGIAQCKALRASFNHHSSVVCVVSSPMRRALQTALYSFASDALATITALDLLQETSDSPNDIGSSVESLKAQFGDAIDFSSVSPSWTDKGTGSMWEADVDKVTARAALTRRVLKEMAGSGDHDLVVVCHAEYLHFLTDDWEGVTLECRMLKFCRQEFVQLAN